MQLNSKIVKNNLGNKKSNDVRDLKLQDGQQRLEADAVQHLRAQ